MVCLMFPVGCIGVLNAVSGECLRPNAKVSEAAARGLPTNGERVPEVALSFDGGSLDEDVPTEDQRLVVSGTPQEPVLFEQDDPDSCPDAEFRR
ncbi:hypothetical protein [Streptomyces himastatinicus]|uniref:hypothetical protein n=1 Tax=Streptomyces himastatinicus TaxID=998084 RepID=UPI00142F30B1|nr:hypothetical protein [Streptomyces himastatinicus]